MTEQKIYHRLIYIDLNSPSSIFLFGPRGTGKTSWIKSNLNDSLYFDLLNTGIFNDFIAGPERLEKRIPKKFDRYIVIDEVQKIPELLNEVHRLIETHGYRFVLTGSSARSLRRKGVNLLAGRALNYTMHPLTCYELKDDFSLLSVLQFGLLPSVYHVTDPQHYLETYINTYLREEILQEGLMRNLSQFARFLETASFSQGQVVNMSEIARETGIDRKLVNEYFAILEDLLIGYWLPVFTKRAKRRLIASPKFYLFDPGVYRILRPKGPLDAPEEIEGAALETLFLAHLRALNDYYRLGYKLFYWRTSNQVEVDFIVYGEHGLFAFEIKRSRKLSRSDLSGLRAFSNDYNIAQCYLLYGGDHEEFHDNIHVMPFEQGLNQLLEILSKQGIKSTNI
ncbi:MAG: ATPase [Legionellales bacterium RIFCSPHIGHO2_12_FULL_37_14]|nr:MAG: ATPase [Legionellales bacterium RIFCSPHIGHO2_12_FULL_37_14]